MSHPVAARQVFLPTYKTKGGRRTVSRLSSLVSRLSLATLVRTFLGCVLLLAALLKGHELATGPVAETGLLTSRWFLVIVVELELAFGLWLLTGLYPRPTHAAALSWFVALGLTALYKAAAGEESCGCFGRVPVSPWYALVMDVAAVTALWSCRSVETPLATATRNPLRLILGVALFLVIAPPAAVAMAQFTPARVTGDGELIGDSDLVVLEPETWVGSRLPLLGHIDIGGELSRGHWIVVLYRHDCPLCHEAIPRYVERARCTDGQPGTPRIALIELPPYGGPRNRFAPASGPCKSGRLSDAKEWFAETPVEIALLDGVVSSVTLAEKIRLTCTSSAGALN